MWVRADNVGMDKESYSKDAAHNSRENSQRMAAAPTAKPLAFAAPWRDTVGPSQIHNFPYNQPARPDIATPNELSKTI